MSKILALFWSGGHGFDDRLKFNPFVSPQNVLDDTFHSECI